MSVPYFAYLAAMGVYGIWQLKDTAETRWQGVTSYSYEASKEIVARMTVHVFIQTYVLWGKNKILMQMTVHHVISLACFGFAVMCGRCHFFGCIAVAAETSTVFLSALQGAMALSTTQGPISGLVKAVSGVLLWLAFIVFRLISLPVWL